MGLVASCLGSCAASCGCSALNKCCGGKSSGSLVPHLILLGIMTIIAIILRFW